MRKFGYFRVAVATPTVKVADCNTNAEHIVESICQANRSGVEVILFPELSITGYTCADLFLQATLLRGAEKALSAILSRTREIDTAAIVGLPVPFFGKLYNCAVVIAKGAIMGIVPKAYIPNYGEFYEARWFASWNESHNGAKVSLCGQESRIGNDLIFNINGTPCAIEICEELWVASPPSSKSSAIAQVIFNPSASPATVGKYSYLKHLVSQQSARCLAGYVYASSGFGESSTDLVFTGTALVYENGTKLAASARYAIESQLIMADIDVDKLQYERQRMSTFHATMDNRYEIVGTKLEVDTNSDLLLRETDKHPFVPANKMLRDERCEEILSIQALGLAQRLNATFTKTCVIGISGGLDSTLALLVAVKAFDKLSLDRKGIIAITMPGFGTTNRTYTNATTLCERLGVSLREISIKEACIQHFKDIGLSADDRSVTYENSQARERTQILMDVANKEGGMVIGTGDLSELALGWATYNGDQMSMYGVNGSIPKTLVRYLIGWVAESYQGDKLYDILTDIIATPVSPELLPADENGDIAQKTEDLVGPYELHDFFLYNIVRCGFLPQKVLFLATKAFKDDYTEETILHWLRIFIRRFFTQQFKRSAMPDGPKVGSVTLSPRGDWRMPSDASYKLWLEEL